MLIPPQNWQPCFVDPWRGVAHFDGLTIEADPITSPRQDFVLPCIEDEQVFFCRMLRALLPARADREERHAVDLGMGSGVLSLYAASLGMRVTGIDICDRAKQFADYNQRQNHAALQKNSQSIKFLLGDWNDTEQLQPLKGQADYILVNAPFSPCPDGYGLTRCAFGGIMGQDAFLETLPIAYSLLKEQGRVYSIQLLLTDDQGKPKNDLFKVTGSQNDRWSSVRVFKALEPVFVREFLEGQYRSVTKGSHGASLEVYPEEFFCLAFIELTKGGITQDEVELVPPISNPLAPLPNWTWQDRIHIHHLVLENYSRYQNVAHESENGTEDQEDEHRAHIWIPSIALFLQRTNPYSALQPESGDPSSDVISKILTPTQAQIDRWISRNDLLRSPSNPDGFDCLMVEAVPWHFATSRLKLRTETAIWASAKNGGNVEGLSRALGRVLIEIARFVKDERSIFLHRDHIRATKAHAWQQAVYFYQSECESDKKEPIQAPELRINSPACRHGDILVSSHLHELKDFGTRSENPSTDPFESCLQQALRAYTGIMRLEGLLSKKTSHCYFLSLPMPMLKPKSKHAESGIVYVYAWSPQPWSASHECLVSDLARLASFLYEELYAESTRFQLDLILRQTMLVSAAHEMKKLVYKIDSGMTPHFAHLVQDYFLLFLELELGSTFDEVSECLAVGSGAALRKMSDLAYVFEKLRGKTFNPQTLSETDIVGWEKEAREAISVNSSKLLPIEKPVRGKPNKQLHFAAAFIAGLRNAISHCNKEGNTDLEIKIECDAGCIRIENSYTNTNNGEDDKKPMNVKREFDQPGTESVLQYHERQVFIDDPGYQARSKILKLRCKELRDNIFRHTWTTDLIVPGSGKGKAV
jgi:hypothetical protein